MISLLFHSLQFLFTLPALCTPAVPGRPLTGLQVPVSEEGLEIICQKAQVSCGLILDQTRPPKSDQLVIVSSPVPTVADYLDRFVALAPQYKWSDHEGVIRVEPRKLPPSVRTRVFGTPVRQRRERGDALKIAHDLLAGVGIGYGYGIAFGGGIPPEPKFPIVDLRFSTRNAANALDRLAETVGGTVWILHYKNAGPHTYYHFDLACWGPIKADHFAPREVVESQR